MPDTFLENFQQSVVSARSLSAIFRVFCRKFDLPHLPFANSVFCFADCSSLNSNCSPRAQHFTFSCSRISQIGENIPRLSASIFVASLGDLVFIIVVGAVTSSSTRRCWCRWSSTRPPTWCCLIDYNRRLLFRKNVCSRNFQQKSGKSSGRKGADGCGTFRPSKKVDVLNEKIIILCVCKTEQTYLYKSLLLRTIFFCFKSM